MVNLETVVHRLPLDSDIPRGPTVTSLESKAKDSEYETINDVVNHDDYERAAAIAVEGPATGEDIPPQNDTSQNPAYAAFENGGGVESYPNSEIKQNPAYGVLGQVELSTEYQNVITPWSYYDDEMINGNQEKFATAEAPMIIGNAPLPNTATASPRFDEMKVAQNPIFDIMQGIAKSKPSSEIEISQNPAYGVLGQVELSTEYQNVITPWSYYDDEMINGNQEKFATAEAPMIIGNAPLPNTATASPQFDEMKVAQNPIFDIMQGIAKSKSSSEIEISQNPAYAVLEREEGNTGYQNVITPWSYYDQ